MARVLAAVCLVCAVAGCSAAPSPVPSSPVPSSPVPSPLASSPLASAPPAAVIVPDVVGLRAIDAEAVISSSGFLAAFSSPLSLAAEWTVVSQQPEAGETAAPKSTVRLAVADQIAQSGARRLVTSRGLTFDIAAATCDLHGRSVSEGGGMLTSTRLGPR